MSRGSALALILLTAFSLVGLAVLVLHFWGVALLSDSGVKVVLCAQAVLLVLVGFSIGISHQRAQSTKLVDRDVVRRLKIALDVERKQRIEISRERYRLRQSIVSLEAQVQNAQVTMSNAETVPDLRQPAAVLETEARLEDLAAICERLRGELKDRKRRMVDLQVELSVALTEADEAKMVASQATMSPPAGSPIAQVQEFGGQTLNEVLDQIVAIPGVRVALVADDQGLVVDTAGEILMPDSLAAVSGIVAEFSPSVTELLPVGEIVTVVLGDVGGTFLEVRYFTLFEARCALVIISDEDALQHGISRRATGVIAARLNE